jgi:hypothetical protein
MLGLDPGIHRSKAAGESPPFFVGGMPVVFVDAALGESVSLFAAS